MKVKRRDEWNSMLEDFIENPKQSVDHLAFGMNKEQRNRAKGLKGGKPVPTWV